MEDHHEPIHGGEETVEQVIQDMVGREVDAGDVGPLTGTGKVGGWIEVFLAAGEGGRILWNGGIWTLSLDYLWCLVEVLKLLMSQGQRLTRVLKSTMLDSGMIGVPDCASSCWAG